MFWDGTGGASLCHFPFGLITRRVWICGVIEGDGARLAVYTAGQSWQVNDLSSPLHYLQLSCLV
jgi:hypothetical protein